MGGGLSAVFMAGLPASLCGGLVCLSSASGWFTSLLPAFYQPFTSLWLVGWLAGWLAGGLLGKVFAIIYF